ncbi:MAG TPA: DUF2207 domain-containing protein [Burkholderiales bacterium]|nr:DUF2207 domain-containing protein [Burkholderiales bacterium]
MKRWLALAAAALCLSAAATERVTDFHSTIRVAADGELEVIERIAVEAEGREIRRGILRDFPTEYRDRFGNRVSVPFDVRRVRRDGAAESWTVERVSNGMRIRIGRSDYQLPAGTHTYEITYRTARQIGHFPDHDELYWNVNGNGWTFPFEHISAEVQLPKAVPASELRAEAYTGPQGARGRDYQSMVRDGAVGFTSTARFRAGEGMTIVVGFPKGIIHEPGIVRRAGWFFSQNKGTAAGVVGFALMLWFLYWRWSLVGRDPSAGPKFPRYEAPKGFSPAAVRFIDRQGFDDRCFAAALLGLGSRGYLKIRQRLGDFHIEPTGAAIQLLPGERAVAPLASAGRVLGKTYDPAVQAARSELERELKVLYEETAFSRNNGSMMLGVLLGAFTIGLMVFLQAAVSMIVLIALLSVATLMAFRRWLPAYSVSGRHTQDEIEGLRQYLGVAERDELARKKAPPKTAEEFSKFLPYAVALDVEKTWADRFALALGTAAVAKAVSDWYQGSDSSFSMSGLTSSVSALGETVSSASTAPGSSSGSDGGGSSGGGGGGGGGSGW